jgi:hypothetical protein
MPQSLLLLQINLPRFYITPPCHLLLPHWPQPQHLSLHLHLHHRVRLHFCMHHLHT